MNNNLLKNTDWLTVLYLTVFTASVIGSAVNVVMWDRKIRPWINKNIKK